jgi:hypothetical protein
MQELLLPILMDNYKHYYNDTFDAEYLDRLPIDAKIEYLHNEILKTLIAEYNNVLKINSKGNIDYKWSASNDTAMRGKTIVEKIEYMQNLLLNELKDVYKMYNPTNISQKLNLD